MKKNYLCIDYGEKFCGIAVATTFIAEPIEVIPTKNVCQKISELIDKYAINQIIFGISENLTAEKTIQFAESVALKTNLPVTFHDETLSSQDTRRSLAKNGVKKHVRESKIDHYVAASILQDFLG